MGTLEKEIENAQIRLCLAAAGKQMPYQEIQCEKWGLEGAVSQLCRERADEIGIPSPEDPEPVLRRLKSPFQKAEAENVANRLTEWVGRIRTAGSGEELAGSYRMACQCILQLVLLAWDAKLREGDVVLSYPEPPDGTGAFCSLVGRVMETRGERNVLVDFRNPYKGRKKERIEGEIKALCRHVSLDDTLEEMLCGVLMPLEEVRKIDWEHMGEQERERLLEDDGYNGC